MYSSQIQTVDTEQELVELNVVRNSHIAMNWHVNFWMDLGNQEERIGQDYERTP